MKKQNNQDYLFSISLEDLQTEAIEKIGRELNEDEIDVAKKGLMWGLMTDIDSVYNTIFYEML
jgi:hypothetical protein